MVKIDDQPERSEVVEAAKKVVGEGAVPGVGMPVAVASGVGEGMRVTVLGTPSCLLMRVDIVETNNVLMTLSAVAAMLSGEVLVV